MQTGSERRIAALDALRALAAFLVLASHVAFWTGEAGWSGVGIIAARGDVGVAVFFALPAFLDGAKDAAEGFLVTMVWNQDVKYSGAQNLYTRLKKALGGDEPSQHAAQSYAGMLAAAALSFLRGGR